MSERARDVLVEETQPGRLELGLFCTISRSRGGFHGYARVSVVPRRGSTVTAGDWHWTGGSVPLEVVQELVAVIDAALCSSIEAHLGIQEPLF